MQFAMNLARHLGGYPAPNAVVRPPSAAAAKTSAGLPLMSQTCAGRPHGAPRSFAVDANDLRRRLYVVIAEQEAQDGGRRDERAVETTAEAKTKTNGTTVTGAEETARVESNARSFAARMTKGERTTTITTVEPPPPLQSKADAAKTNAAPDAKPERSKSKSRSKPKAKPVKPEDKLRRRASSLSRATETRTKKNNKPSPEAEGDEEGTYHHVPREAAAQFARTATSDSMRDGGRLLLVHSLSQSALRFHREGRASDRAELEASTTPAQQGRALRRARSHRERLLERNRFQSTPTFVAEGEEKGRGVLVVVEKNNKKKNEGGEGRRVKARRDSLGGDIILEDEEFKMQQQQQHRYHFSHRHNAPAVADLAATDERVSSDGAVVVVDLAAAAAAAANEHRVDWTQSDEKEEMQQSQSQQEKSRSGTTTKKPPLLRRADSIWLLKGKKFGTLAMGSSNSSSSSKHHHTTTVIREKEVGVGGGRKSTGSPPPLSPTSKAPRRGFLARFKR